MWKRRGKVLIEKKKRESGPKLRLGTCLVPIQDQGGKSYPQGSTQLVLRSGVPSEPTQPEHRLIALAY